MGICGKLGVDGEDEDEWVLGAKGEKSRRGSKKEKGTNDLGKENDEKRNESPY